MGHIPFLFTFTLNDFLICGSLVFLMMILFAVGLFFLCRHFDQQCQVKEAERIRNLMKNMRHDWMNHIQVIMGYQLLKQHDKVDRYLQKLTKKSLAERAISELHYPPLATALLTIPYDYAQWNWQFKQDDSISSLSVQKQRTLTQILHYVLPWLVDQIESQVAWTDIEFNLSYKHHCFILQFGFSGKENEMKSKVKPIEWSTIPRKRFLRKAVYEWSEDQHTLVLKIPVR